jgi:hypothetical protein
MISTCGQLTSKAAIRLRSQATICGPLGRLAGPQTAATMRPVSSNTTIGWKPHSS